LFGSGVGGCCSALMSCNIKTMMLGSIIESQASGMVDDFFDVE
jgi:hypothetical protein